LQKGYKSYKLPYIEEEVQRKTQGLTKFSMQAQVFPSTPSLQNITCDYDIAILY